MNAQRRGEATTSRLSGDRPAAAERPTAAERPAAVRPVTEAVATVEGREPIEVAPGIRLGGASVPVFGGPRRGADVVHVRLAAGPGPGLTETALAELAAIRDQSAGPLVVSGVSADNAAAVARSADAIVLEAAALTNVDGTRVDAVGALDPSALGTELAVLLTGDADWPLELWRAAVQVVRGAGVSAVAVVLPAASASIRLATGAPVIVDVGTEAGLVAPAAAAGADGIWLGEHADEVAVAAARDVVARVAPTVRQVAPGTLAGCREAIDNVDAALASLLEYRAGLAAQVQELKPISGHAGRSHAREAEIVRGMAGRAPALGVEGLRPIVEAIIVAGLDAAERNRQPDPPVWRL